MTRREGRKKMAVTIDRQRNYACIAIVSMFENLLWAVAKLGQSDELTKTYAAHIDGAALALWAAKVIGSDERVRICAMLTACKNYSGPAPR